MYFKNVWSLTVDDAVVGSVRCTRYRFLSGAGLPLVCCILPSPHERVNGIGAVSV